MFRRLTEWTPGDFDAVWHEGSNLPDEADFRINGSHWSKIADSLTVDNETAKIITYAPEVINAAATLCEALVRNGFGETSDRALPGEYDTLVLALNKVLA